MGDITTVLQVQDLCFAYPERRLFMDWSATISAGATLVLGGDGSGKTTLLQLLAREVLAESGTLALVGVGAQVFWQDPRSPALDAFTPQQWWADLSTRYSTWNAAALAAHVQGFALGSHLHKALHQLSAGTRRKVLMAAALASGAALTLIDEPVAGLDRASVQYLQQVLVDTVKDQPNRALVVAHYEILGAVPWVAVIKLPD